MTQFHEGQEVEVRDEVDGDYAGDLTEMPWRKAKIVEGLGMNCYQVLFPDGTRGVFDVERIRATVMDQMEEASRTWPSWLFD